MSQKSFTFVPKTDYDHDMAERYPNATPADVCRIHGRKFSTMPFRCPRCAHRPVQPRGDAFTIFCKCGGILTSHQTQLDYPRSSADWLKWIQTMDAAKAMNQESKKQNDPERN